MITAMISPFLSDGTLDEAALRLLLQRQCHDEVTHVLMLGSTAEVHSLTVAEQSHILRIARETLEGQALMVGTGQADTAMAIDKALWAHDEGADVLLVSTPYYNRPCQDGLLAHFSKIADQSRLPIVLYNVPSRTGVDLQVETALELLKHPMIVGIKEASGDVLRIPQLKQSGCQVWSGDDQTGAVAMMLGATGIISVYGNWRIERLCQLARLAKDNDLPGLRQWQSQEAPLLAALATCVNPVAIKTVMAKLAWIEEQFRLPLLPLPADKKAQLLEHIALHQVPTASHSGSYQ